MQRPRPNVGRVSVPVSGRNATRLASTPQPQPRTYKPAEYGAPDAPGTGPRPVPPPQVTRSQPVPPNDVPRSGSRVVTAVGSVGLAQSCTETSTPPEPVQQQAPVLNNANSV